MQYQSENKVCQNCRGEFIIEPDDFSFYEKMKVPTPTFCPTCRLQRRLAWMIGVILFKRKCDSCNEYVFSLYEPEAPYIVFCHKCWWSDKWDARDYALDVDFSKPFLEQWNDLLHKTPILGLSVDTITGNLSPYTNHVGNAKNCYMIFYSDYVEDSMFGFYLSKSKSLLDCSMVWESELCFDCTNGFKNFKLFSSFGNVTQSLDSAFLRDCDNCQYCFGSANLKNKKYVFFNKQYSKEEYMKKISEIDLGSYEVYESIRKKVNNHFKNYIPRPVYDDFSMNSTGSYVFQSKNCKSCFDSSYCQDCKYMMMIKLPKVTDSYDYTEWGENASNIYESITVGCDANQIKFSHESGFGIKNIEYSKLSTGSNYNFGCVSIKKSNYCILNKQYSKEEYFEMVEKIKKHMNDVPYIDKGGRVYKYGEFFPMEFSPHSYNNTFADFFFPKNEIDVKNNNLKYYKFDKKIYPITKKYQEIPDNIKDVTDTILKEVFSCKTCPRGFKITNQELELSRRLNVPLSRQCSFCRVSEKVKRWVNQMKQIQRNCDNCGISFITHYSKIEAQKIYCKKCYQNEVY